MSKPTGKLLFAYQTIAALEQKVFELEHERNALREALKQIADYWNRDLNDEAMLDACWHAINTASAVLYKEDD